MAQDVSLARPLMPRIRERFFRKSTYEISSAMSYCFQSLDSDIPHVVQGSMKLRRPFCGGGFLQRLKSFPSMRSHHKGGTAVEKLIRFAAAPSSLTQVARNGVESLGSPNFAKEPDNMCDFDVDGRGVCQRRYPKVRSCTLLSCAQTHNVQQSEQ